ncbi:HIT zinc finger protein [Toxoplasma gondii GAB2-2007-GAL-DOM2]|uniref:HIT zinc finger protein n=9 Tax=Toxoplasma gondii TaxID=5811 RepID=A0A125YU62_TOXGV|nr:HIT zinc finger protein [Toxoplasma gondii GT1]ESS30723.1 HIT zinc finger protein [Toxoplasma gondii VEG]KAF4643668.1 HIT zinc finger protein [Toxoplasma gondii]KFG40418.1 HIT zinc finger protein [Toxoplasma gondii GAB2-2007-GAL-DOM2]RQX69578.1 HIT zinc finger protein [Toxoplasma gondii CAST]
MDDELSIGISAASARSSGATCQVCHRAASKYTCPKCHTLYCSSDCYSSHNGGRCVRQFQEEQVVAAVRAARVTALDKRRFEHKLSRIRRQELEEEEESEEEEEEDRSAERSGRGARGQAGREEAQEGDEGQVPPDEAALLEGMDDERHAQLIDLAQRGILDEDALTAEERRAFHNALGTGALAQYLEPWEPWWQKVETRQPVAPPPHCCCSSETKVHFTVFNSLLQLLYAYAHCMRSYNGEVEEVELQEACQHILAIAQALGSPQPPRTPMEALDVAIGATSSETVQCKDPAFNALCLQDFQGLFTCREHAFRAIEEIMEMLHGLLQMVAEVQEEEKAEEQRRSAGQMRDKGKGSSKQDDALNKALKERRHYLKSLGRKLQSSERKVLFLGSFVWHHWGEVAALMPAALVQVKAKEEQLQGLLKEIQAMNTSRAAAARASAMARRCDAIGAVSLASLSPQTGKTSDTARASREAPRFLEEKTVRTFASTPNGTENGKAAGRDLSSRQNTVEISNAVMATSAPTLTGKPTAVAVVTMTANGGNAVLPGTLEVPLDVDGTDVKNATGGKEDSEKREVEDTNRHIPLIEEC